MQTHLNPFAQITASQHLNLDGLLSQLTVMCTVYAKRAIEQGVAFVPGAPFYAADADLATLRLSFATADWEDFGGGGEVGECDQPNLNSLI